MYNNCKEGSLTIIQLLLRLMCVTKQTIKFINKIKRNTTNILSILICPRKQSKRPCLLTCVLAFHDVSRNVAPRLKTFSPNMNLFLRPFYFRFTKGTSAPYNFFRESVQTTQQRHNFLKCKTTGHRIAMSIEHFG